MTRSTRRWMIAAILATALASAFLWAAGCSSDKKSDEPHWFDCTPVLERMDTCGIQIAFDDMNVADTGEAYESCQFAKGNMWLAAFKCYKEQDTCLDFGECLPEHGFITPHERGESYPGEDVTDDDTADDDTADDDTLDDDATDDDTGDDDASDDDTTDDDTGV